MLQPRLVRGFFSAPSFLGTNIRLMHEYGMAWRAAISIGGGAQGCMGASVQPEKVAGCASRANSILQPRPRARALFVGAGWLANISRRVRYGRGVDLQGCREERVPPRGLRGEALLLQKLRSYGNGADTRTTTSRISCRFAQPRAVRSVPDGTWRTAHRTYCWPPASSARRI